MRATQYRRLYGPVQFAEIVLALISHLLDPLQPLPNADYPSNEMAFPTRRRPESQTSCARSHSHRRLSPLPVVNMVVLAYACMSSSALHESPKYLARCLLKPLSGCNVRLGRLHAIAVRFVRPTLSQ